MSDIELEIGVDDHHIHEPSKPKTGFNQDEMMKFLNRSQISQKVQSPMTIDLTQEQTTVHEQIQLEKPISLSQPEFQIQKPEKSFLSQINLKAKAPLQRITDIAQSSQGIEEDNQASQPKFKTVLGKNIKKKTQDTFTSHPDNEGEDQYDLKYQRRLEQEKQKEQNHQEMVQLIDQFNHRRGLGPCDWQNLGSPSTVPDSFFQQGYEGETGMYAGPVLTQLNSIQTYPYFQVFFCPQTIEIIIKNTELRYRQKMDKLEQNWAPLTISDLEIEAYLGILLRAGITEQMVIPEYVQRSLEFQNNIRNLFDVEKFRAIHNLLHFSDNSDLLHQHRDSFKIDALISQVNENFRSRFISGEYLSIRKYSLVSGIKKSPQKIDEASITFDQFTLFECNSGYILGLEFNIQHEGERMESLVENQLTQITNILSPFGGKYHQVLTSLSVTNKELFKTLRDMQIGGLGPIQIQNAQLSRELMDRVDEFSVYLEQFMSLISEDQVIMTIKARREAIEQRTGFISNFIDNFIFRSRKTKERKSLMEKVYLEKRVEDRRGKHDNSYLLMDRNFQWWRTAFVRILYSAISNAHVLYTMSKPKEKPKTLEEFIQILSSQLVGRFREAENSVRNLSFGGDVFQRFDNSKPNASNQERAPTLSKQIAPFQAETGNQRKVMSYLDRGESVNPDTFRDFRPERRAKSMINTMHQMKVNEEKQQFRCLICRNSTTRYCVSCSKEFGRPIAFCMPNQRNRNRNCAQMHEDGQFTYDDIVEKLSGQQKRFKPANEWEIKSMANGAAAQRKSFNLDQTYGYYGERDNNNPNRDNNNSFTSFKPTNANNQTAIFNQINGEKPKEDDKNLINMIFDMLNKAPSAPGAQDVSKNLIQNQLNNNQSNNILNVSSQNSVIFADPNQFAKHMNQNPNSNMTFNSQQGDDKLYPDRKRVQIDPENNNFADINQNHENRLNYGGIQLNIVNYTVSQDQNQDKFQKPLSSLKPLISTIKQENHGHPADNILSDSILQTGSPLELEQIRNNMENQGGESNKTNDKNAEMQAEKEISKQPERVLSSQYPDQQMPKQEKQRQIIVLDMEDQQAKQRERREQRRQKIAAEQLAEQQEAAKKKEIERDKWIAAQIEQFKLPQDLQDIYFQKIKDRIIDQEALQLKQQNVQQPPGIRPPLPPLTSKQNESQLSIPTSKLNTSSISTNPITIINQNQPTSHNIVIASDAAIDSSLRKKNQKNQIATVINLQSDGENENNHQQKSTQSGNLIRSKRELSLREQIIQHFQVKPFRFLSPQKMQLKPFTKDLEPEKASLVPEFFEVVQNQMNQFFNQKQVDFILQDVAISQPKEHSKNQKKGDSEKQKNHHQSQSSQIQENLNDSLLIDVQKSGLDPEITSSIKILFKELKHLERLQLENKKRIESLEIEEPIISNNLIVDSEKAVEAEIEENSFQQSNNIEQKLMQQENQEQQQKIDENLIIQKNQQEIGFTDQPDIDLQNIFNKLDSTGFDKIDSNSLFTCNEQVNQVIEGQLSKLGDDVFLSYKDQENLSQDHKDMISDRQDQNNDLILEKIVSCIKNSEYLETHKQDKYDNDGEQINLLLIEKQFQKSNQQDSIPKNIAENPNIKIISTQVVLDLIDAQINIESQQANFNEKPEAQDIKTEGMLTINQQIIQENSDIKADLEQDSLIVKNTGINEITDISNKTDEIQKVTFSLAEELQEIIFNEVFQKINCNLQKDLIEIQDDLQIIEKLGVLEAQMEIKQNQSEQRIQGNIDSEIPVEPQEIQKDTQQLTCQINQDPVEITKYEIFEKLSNNQQMEIEIEQIQIMHQGQSKEVCESFGELIQNSSNRQNPIIESQATPGEIFEEYDDNQQPAELSQEIDHPEFQKFQSGITDQPLGVSKLNPINITILELANSLQDQNKSTEFMEEDQFINMESNEQSKENSVEQIQPPQLVAEIPDHQPSHPEPSKEIQIQFHGIIQSQQIIEENQESISFNFGKEPKDELQTEIKQIPEDFSQTKVDELKIAENIIDNIKSSFFELKDVILDNKEKKLLTEIKDALLENKFELEVKEVDLVVQNQENLSDHSNLIQGNNERSNSNDTPNFQDSEAIEKSNQDQPNRGSVSDEIPLLEESESVIHIDQALQNERQNSNDTPILEDPDSIERNQSQSLSSDKTNKNQSSQAPQHIEEFNKIQIKQDKNQIGNPNQVQLREDSMLIEDSNQENPKAIEKSHVIQKFSVEQPVQLNSNEPINLDNQMSEILEPSIISLPIEDSNKFLQTNNEQTPENLDIGNIPNQVGQLIEEDKKVIFQEKSIILNDNQLINNHSLYNEESKQEFVQCSEIKENEINTQLELGGFAQKEVGIVQQKNYKDLNEEVQIDQRVISGSLIDDLQLFQNTSSMEIQKPNSDVIDLNLYMKSLLYLMTGVPGTNQEPDISNQKNGLEQLEKQIKQQLENPDIQIIQVEHHSVQDKIYNNQQSNSKEPNQQDDFDLDIEVNSETPNINPIKQIDDQINELISIEKLHINLQISNQQQSQSSLIEMIVQNHDVNESKDKEIEKNKEETEIDDKIYPQEG